MKGFISADDHVVEHPTVWSDRLSRAKWGDRIPHVERDASGDDYWSVDGRRLPFSRVIHAGVAAADGAKTIRRWDEVPGAAKLPARRLNAMDEDGVEYSVLYPMVAGLAGELFGVLSDGEFELACVQAYNDWLIEEWARVSKRFVPQCIVPLYPVEKTVGEIERAVAMGHKGIVFPGTPMHLREIPHMNDPEFDRVWATCQELGVPLCFHAGSSRGLRFPPSSAMHPALRDALDSVTRSASAVFEIANLLFSRILLRHPRLQVVFAESTVGWASFLLEYADYQFEKDQCQGYALKPSEMFLRQCFLTSWYDQIPAGISYIKAENILWETNFPMANSTWPSSRQVILECLQALAEPLQRKILSENAARLYGIET
jgi:predicted TIM-barrel fold metal-dependent hydrolase